MNNNLIVIVIAVVVIALIVMVPGAIATVFAVRQRAKLTLRDPELEHRFTTFIRN
jgi:hypothetical protein